MIFNFFFFLQVETLFSGIPEMSVAWFNSNTKATQDNSSTLYHVLTALFIGASFRGRSHPLGSTPSPLKHAFFVITYRFGLPTFEIQQKDNDVKLGEVKWRCATTPCKSEQQKKSVSNRPGHANSDEVVWLHAFAISDTEISALILRIFFFFPLIRPFYNLKHGQYSCKRRRYSPTGLSYFFHSPLCKIRH